MKSRLRDICRGEALMSLEVTEQYLREETWGVLSVYGDDDFPYGVPMNYVWDKGTILLHCKSENSHRLDALSRNNKVCFTVVPEHELDREKWTTIYTSIIVFGTAEIIRDQQAKRVAMHTFTSSLAPQ